MANCALSARRTWLARRAGRHLADASDSGWPAWPTAVRLVEGGLFGHDGNVGDKESWASSEGVRRSMQANRGRDTGPELAVRRLLHADGLRFRVGIRPVVGLRRTADIVFTRSKIAVFIDGCFWHGCPVHATSPKTNSGYWSPKLLRNIERDLETTAAIRAEGWRVLRFWAHENPREVADAIEEEVKARRRSES